MICLRELSWVPVRENNSAPPLASCVTLGRLYNLSVPKVLHL